MRLNTSALTIVVALAAATGRASAQAPAAAEPPPPWELKLGASFVGTSGNTDTSSTGASLDGYRQWTIWRVEGAASAVLTSEGDRQTAEQYLAALRTKRALTDRISATSGIRLERDRLSGIDLRSLLDGGLSYVLVKRPEWQLDGLTALVWRHEDRTTDEVLDHAEAALELKNKYVFGTTGDTTQRFTFYPDFTSSTAYRSETELTAQASMNKRLALKIAFLWRYANDPVPGFKRSDTTTTASIVVRWRAETPAAP
jgi:putative salt-induced outer membrane protein YdiY